MNWLFITTLKGYLLLTLVFRFIFPHNFMTILHLHREATLFFTIVLSENRILKFETANEMRIQVNITYFIVWLSTCVTVWLVQMYSVIHLKSYNILSIFNLNLWIKTLHIYIYMQSNMNGPKTKCGSTRGKSEESGEGERRMKTGRWMDGRPPEARKQDGGHVLSDWSVWRGSHSFKDARLSDPTRGYRYAATRRIFRITRVYNIYIYRPDQDRQR